MEAILTYHFLTANTFQQAYLQTMVTTPAWKPYTMSCITYLLQMWWFQFLATTRRFQRTLPEKYLKKHTVSLHHAHYVHLTTTECGLCNKNAVKLFQEFVDDTRYWMWLHDHAYSFFVWSSYGIIEWEDTQLCNPIVKRCFEHSTRLVIVRFVVAHDCVTT